MKNKLILLSLSICIVSTTLMATEQTDSSKIQYNNAFIELKAMVEGKQPADFEKAVFTSENAYWNNEYSYTDFQKKIDGHLLWVQKLMEANDKSDTMNFSVNVNANGRFNLDDIRYTEEEKKELYNKAFKNWAIFKYITDTTIIFPFVHPSFAYASNDPFGMKDWSNSQVLNLITSNEQKGNCFALTGLYKILANRLGSDAKICTAPQHIYIQHQDHKGDFYNVELATAGHPGDGMIQTLTYTTTEAIMSGIALRGFNEKESIGLCLVNLAKSYEHKFHTKNDAFILKCAELALKYDSLNLNALLLKQQVLDEKVTSYALKNYINDINQLKKDTRISSTLVLLQKHLSKLYQLGYRQMPLDMQQLVMNGYNGENTGSLYADKNPKPFTTVKPKNKDDEKYWSLSHGTFQEVFEHKKLENYGHFVFNTETKNIASVDTTSNKNFIIDPVAFAYDFGARMYDARLGRFISTDPHASKYAGWSPYAAFADNPINNIDPDGRDVIVLSDKDAAKHQGHQAVLIGDNKNGWTYISKDGADNGGSSGKARFTVMTFKTVEEFRNSAHNAELVDGQNHSNTGGGENKNPIYKLDGDGKKIQRYDEAFYIGTTQANGSSTDAASILAGKKSASSDYCLMNGDCSDVVTAALNAGKNSNGKQLQNGESSGYWGERPRTKQSNIESKNEGVDYDKGIIPDNNTLQKGEKGKNE